MKNSIFDEFRKHRTIISNFSYLSVLQGINILLPFIAYPYLIRVLGADLYGKIIFAQTIVAYFSIFINFGFNISGTQEISLHRDNNTKLSEIVSSILIIKLILWIISLTVLVILLVFIPSLSVDINIYLFTFGVTFYELLFPQWFFLGIERMKYITIINLIIKSFFLIFIFLIIKKPVDYLYVPLLNSIGALIGGGLAMYIVIYKEKVALMYPSVIKIKLLFKKSLPLFISRISSIKDNTPTFFIGVFLGDRQVAYYDLSYKIIRVFIAIFDQITNAIFPYIVKNKEPLLSKKIIKYSFISQTVLYLIICYLSNYLVLLLAGKSMLPAQPIIYITSLLIYRPLSSLIGTIVLITNNHLNSFAMNLIYSTFFYFAITSLLYVFNVINLYTLSSTIVVALLFEILHKIYLIKKFNLINWIK